MNKPASALFLSLLLPVLPGCLFGSTSKVDYRGRHVSPEMMEQVQPGATQQFVLEVFGEPSSRSGPEAGGERWAWRYSKETRKSGSVFLILGTRSEKIEQGSVYVQFRDGRVTKVWRVEA